MSCNLSSRIIGKLKQVDKYVPFYKCRIKENFVYKISSYFQIISKILGVIITYYLWKAVYDNSGVNVINGFSFPEMIQYIIMSYITTNIVQIGVAFDMGEEVQDGSIAINLVRPINYKLKMFMSSLATMTYRLLFPSLIVVLFYESYFYWEFGTFSLSIKNILLYIVSVSASFLLYFLFDFSIGIISFYTTYIWGITITKNAILKILTGQLIPLVFFPNIIVKIFEFMPFMSMNYVPVMIFCGKLQCGELIISLLKQFFWIIIFSVISKKLWDHAIRKLMIYGG